MASSGPLSGGTFATAAFGTNDWANPSNAASSNNAYATCALTDGTEGYGNSYYLRATNFGFAIPAGSTIDGIVAEFEGKYAGTLEASLATAQLLIGGSLAGQDKGVGSLTTSDAYYVLGGAADKWTLTPSVAQINNSGFGLAIAFYGDVSVGDTVVSIDHIRITVYYTAPAGGGTAANLLLLGVG